jgi:hypothetical protein
MGPAFAGPICVSEVSARCDDRLAGLGVVGLP